MWLLQLPPKISTPFLNGHGHASPLLSKPTSSATVTHFPRPNLVPQIRAMKSMQGKVVCSTNDKTVAVEVVRLAPHPKYKRRVRKKKKYQAHDPDNQFQVGDTVQLQKTRPISKTKTFLALPVRNSNLTQTNSN
ncbi:30S ribosomal protein S17, chloroplastic isoform X2 [Abrus precatorius]|uniref:Small ribosomal subunit protein uS17c n=1 Tax=Abrus precatorius TaxID=3816 RepID=A0A8B8KGZ6_ABRPR|nr:30S ribosomal protein S17, chloroplastic isoform X2 [Abrus precatorius]